MRRALTLVALVVGGCGGSVGAEPLTLFDDAGNPIDTAPPRDAGADARDAATDAGRDATRDVAPDAWVDPGCPDTPPPAKDFRCDPLAAPPGGCPKGQACFPFVEYPTDPCDHEVYRAACFPAGTGKQGDPCTGGDCAGGYLCVASGAGNVCVATCNPAKVGGCPEGLVCSPTDVPGVGGCL